MNGGWIVKKITILCSALLVALFLTACGTDENETNDTGENNQTEEESNNVGDNTNELADDNTDDQEDDNTDGDQANEDGTSGEGNQDTSATSADAKNQEDMKRMMEELDFAEIEIEISYGNDKEYEAEIERHHNGEVEADVEDEINGVDLDDDIEAFNYIYPNVKKLKITRDIGKQDVIDQMLSAFDLEENYEKFEVEFKYEDGTKISFED